MDNSNLKKRLNTYKTEGGYLKGVDDELLVDILVAWEAWSGSSKDFYTSLGTSYRQMGTLMGRAKKLKREGVMPSTEFKEIKLQGGEPTAGGYCAEGMILYWQGTHKIEFSTVECLLDFLKKAS